jgi:VanZ family protein
MSSSALIHRVYAPEVSRQKSSGLRVHLWAWLPVLAYLAVFAVESTASLGGDRTSDPLRRVAEALFGGVVNAHWGLIHHFIRKTGHFLGYGTFSLVCFRCVWIELQGAASQLLRRLRAHGLAILSTFVVASADELHQRFLPNRTGLFRDVLLDTCGAVALGLVLFLAMTVLEARRRARAVAIYGCDPAYVDLAA